MASCTVSCPGKVLIAGGYLITQEGLPGLVLSTTARFYCNAKIGPADPSTTSLPAKLEGALAASQWEDIALLSEGAADSSGASLPVSVMSPQFHTEWHYSIPSSGSSALRLAPSDASHRNTYVEWAVNSALLASSAFLSPSTLSRAIAALASQGCGFTLRLNADNDFYSQRAHLEAAGKPLTTANLAALPACNPCPRDPVTGKAIINKTGLGSSAALVTSVVAAVLSLLGIVDLREPGASGDASRNISNSGNSSEGASRRKASCVSDRPTSQRLVHDVAQVAHCLAQGKVSRAAAGAAVLSVV